MADEKKYLREILRECRRALPESYVTAVSRTVQLRILRSSYYGATPSVVLYVANDNEVSTDLILTDALRSGRRVMLPRVIPGSHQLAIVRVRDRNELAPGALGLLEPMGAEIVPIADLGEVLFCVPGLAFSRNGQRLGRGGGYFDRVLAAVAPQAITAGLAYSFQLLDRLPESPNDRRLNLIFTESALHVGMDHLFGRSAVAG